LTRTRATLEDSSGEQRRVGSPSSVSSSTSALSSPRVVVASSSIMSATTQERGRPQPQAQAHPHHEIAPLTVMRGAGSLPTTQEMNHSYEREWISEPEYRYNRKRKQLMLSCMVNVCMMVIVIVLATVFVSKRNSSGSASSSSVGSNNNNNNNIPTMAPIPKPTFKPIKERPLDPDGHPVAPPNMVIDLPTMENQNEYAPTQPFPTPPPPPPPTTIPPPPPTPPPPTPLATIAPVTLPPHIPPPTTNPKDSEGYVTAFRSIIETSQGVLPNGEVIYTFGPSLRRKLDDNSNNDCTVSETESCYEFHRGIGLGSPQGSTILSNYDGTVVALLDTPGEEGIVVEHVFPEEVFFHMDKEATDKWYTLYFHATDWQVALNEVIPQGTVLGTTNGDHLHYEVRIGTPCDFQDNIHNTINSCNNLGYDPHVHPLMSLPPESWKNGDITEIITMQLIQDSDAADVDGIVKITSTHPQMNTYSIALINVKNGVTRQSHVLDLNLRTGFDASSIDNLNTQDFTKPYVNPQRWRTTTTTTTGGDANHDLWNTHIVVPSYWICPKTKDEEIVITAEDVWGNFKFLSFGLSVEYDDCPSEASSGGTPPPPPPPPPTEAPITLPPHVPAPSPLASEGYVLAFQDIHKQSEFVLDNGKIMYTFGPSVQLTNEDGTGPCIVTALESCYQFHRGLGLSAPQGSTIYSNYEGKVVAILDTPGEEGLVLEHTFPEEVIFHIDKPGTTTWYTLYFHAAAWTVQENDIVPKGAPLAITNGNHLHYEVRIGTPCDLEDFVKQPDVSCNKEGYDPHIHPIMSFPDAAIGEHQIALTATQNSDSLTKDGIVTVTTPADNPNMNKYTIGVINVQTGATRKTFKIDLNRRTGFDATSIAKLDTQDKTQPYLDPEPFDSENDTHWTIQIVVPASWICPKASEEELVITAEDVWGRFKFVAFGLGSEYEC